MKKLILCSLCTSLCLAMSLTFSSCGGDDNVSVTSVSLNKTALTLTEGTTETLTVTVLPSDATDPTVTWSSDNTTVATVSKGIVTAVTPGTATITATSTDGSKVASCVVTVKELVEEDSNNDTSFTGSGVSMNAIEYEGGNSSSTWAMMDLLSGGSQRYYGKVGTYNKILITLYGSTVTYDSSKDTYSNNDGTSITFALWVSKGNTVARVGTYSQLDAAATSMTKWHFCVNGTTNSFFNYSNSSIGLTSGIVRVSLSGTTYTIDFAGKGSNGDIIVKAHYSGPLTYIDKTK